jgi:hypothetical protein
MSRSNDFVKDLEGDEEIILESKGGLTVILIFGLILTGNSLAVVFLRIQLASFLGQSLIAIDAGSLLISILGAVVITYLYYTRYVKRYLIMKTEDFTLKIGKREYTYPWSDFSIVALSTAPSSYGTKGFVVRLYKEDLSSDYVDLPLYRFPKPDVFYFRELIEKKVGNTRKIT